MNRGERLNKPRDSLFSTKAVEAVPVRKPRGVEPCTSEGMSKCTDLVQTANKLGKKDTESNGSREVLYVKRETAQINR